MRPEVRFAALVLGVALGSTGILAAVVTRGPYLQSGTSDGVVIRWRTDVATDSRVLCGAAPGNLALCADDLTTSTEHSVPVTGLSANTRYYYAIGSSSEILAGDDATHFFETGPLAGSAGPTRIWVLGDSGVDSQGQKDVRDAYYAYTGSIHTDLWLMLGDNAYPSGTDLQYQATLFDVYPEMLRKSVLWPTVGNHDVYSADPLTQTGPYFDMFTLPAAGEAGGLASGTEAYYSFDWANIHFISLDSQSLDPAHVAAMESWLQSDLASTSQDWIIAYWHHPPYSKGSHDSDNSVDSDGRMAAMRQGVLPILEDYGVDLVLTGHSHSYERSYLIDGHYGDSSEFGICVDAGTLLDSSDDYCAASPGTACPGGVIDCDTGGYVVDGGDGRISGAGPYTKAVTGGDPHSGTVYTVVGCSSEVKGGSLDHPAMVISLNVLGSVVLDVDGNRLDALFLDSGGVGRDGFTMLKGCYDQDSDGLCAGVDNCPFDANAGQQDQDSDGVGDACDPCPGDGTNDVDADGVCGLVDDCPFAPNPGQEDADSDGIGDICDACLNNPDTSCVACPYPTINDVDGDGFCLTDLAIVEAGLLDDTALIEAGSGMRYRANELDPGLGLTWTLESFNDSAWSVGAYGIGYETGTGAEALIQTTIPSASRSVYTRVTFDIAGVADLSNLFLGVDYDDGYVAWINGTEVYRSPEMPAGDPAWNTAPISHESSNRQTADYRPFRDISAAALPVLHDGTNVLAIGAWNVAGSTDFLLLPRLSYTTAPPMKFLANGSDPSIGLDWTLNVFDDSAWTAGAFGVGYDTASGAEHLIASEAPAGSYSIYARTWFDIPDVGNITQLYIGSEYDDGYAAWINGTEVYRSPELPVGSLAWDTNSASHESSNGRYPDYGPLTDISGVGLPELLTGQNLLALGVWNSGAPGSSDLVLSPRLSINGGNEDNCPTVPNANQSDADSDGAGDVCDPCPYDPQDDIDSDGSCGNVDNCPIIANPGQEDADSDGSGNVCDPCPSDPLDDGDGDGFCADVDNCPAIHNPDQQDLDSDGTGDPCDDDVDGDGILDDGDGSGTAGDGRCTGGVTLGCDDNCAMLFNPGQEDGDSDGAGDLCDCLPADGTAFDSPHEIANVRLSPNKIALEWDSEAQRSGSGTMYDVMRGSLAELPVGAGVSETCLEDLSVDTASEDAEPVTGLGFFYIIRGSNNCGVGSYGRQSSGPDRTSAACP